MSTTTDPPTTHRVSNSVAWVSVILCAITIFGARLALDKDFNLPVWGKIVAALAPIVPTALLLWVVVTTIREFDELHRQVHLEALAIAYPLSILLIITLGFLQLAIDLPIQDWSYRHIWPLLIVLYLIGLSISWRHYK